MPIYNETNISGTRYQRAYAVSIENRLDHKAVTFKEEMILNLDDGNKVHQKAGSVTEPFTVDNANDTFDVLSPIDGSVLDTMTYEDVYVILSSLYRHVAIKRDQAILDQIQ